MTQAKGYGVLEGLTVTVLVDDSPGMARGILAQHGLSLLVAARTRTGVRHILLDASQDAGPVLSNMRLFRLDPTQIEAMVLSHSHYDHTGGVLGMLAAIGRRPLPVIAPSGVFRPQFTMKPALESIGWGEDETAARQAGAALLLSAAPVSLCAGVVVTGEVPERVPFEASPTISVSTVEGGVLVPDPLGDDISVVGILPEGIVVLSGCSHPGIVSIVEHARHLTGAARVLAVIGGLHLISAGAERIGATVTALKGLGVERVVAGHCTGYRAEAALHEAFGDRYTHLHAGLTVTF